MLLGSFSLSLGYRLSSWFGVKYIYIEYVWFGVSRLLGFTGRGV